MLIMAYLIVIKSNYSYVFSQKDFFGEVIMYNIFILTAIPIN